MMLGTEPFDAEPARGCQIPTLPVDILLFDSCICYTINVERGTKSGLLFGVLAVSTFQSFSSALTTTDTPYLFFPP